MPIVRGWALALAAAVALGLTACGNNPAERVAAGRGIAAAEIRVNGKPVAVDSEIKYQKVYAPAGPLAGALGMTVSFNAKKPEHGATLQRNGKYVHLHLDAYDVHVEGKEVKLDMPALYLHPERQVPMVPVRFVAETFGATVTETPATGRAPAIVNVTLTP